MAAERQDDLFVRSLAKGLQVIEAFGEEKSSHTLSDIAKSTGLTRATARRLLHTLVRLGYAELEDRRFSLSPRVLNLGYSYLTSLGLWNLAEPFMEDLVSAVNESCSASVLDGFDVVYVARVPTRARIMSITLNIGTRLPSHATSMGRVLLAGLPENQLESVLADLPLEAYTDHTVTDRDELRERTGEVRRQGWALVEQGQVEAGIVQIRQALSSYRATGAGLDVPKILALLAGAYGKARQVEEGLDVLVEALNLVDQAGERYYEAELYRLKGELLLAKDETEAESHFRRALEVARGQEARALELRAATSLARLWQQQGKKAEARELLAPIYAWFTEGFDTQDLKDAKALLDELT